MIEKAVNFCARISGKRSKKLKRHLINIGKDNQEWLSNTIDNLRIGLDATTGRKK